MPATNVDGVFFDSGIYSSEYGDKIKKATTVIVAFFFSYPGFNDSSLSSHLHQTIFLISLEAFFSQNKTLVQIAERYRLNTIEINP
jgi:hypothetical protein